MHVNGLYVSDEDEITAIDCREHFEDISLQLLGIDLESNNQVYTKLQKGVYLHWVIPEAMRRGTHDDESTVFPHICNRYHVMRIVKQNSTYRVKTFVIESDVVSDTGRVALLQNGQETPTVSYLGRAYEYEAKESREKTNGLLPHIELTALGYGEPGFSGFFVKCENCLSFHDSLEDIPELTEEETLWYVVVGHYEGCSFEPFAEVKTKAQLEEILRILGWSLTGEMEPDGKPPEILTAGMLSLDKPKKQIRGNNGEDAADFRVSVGTNMPEALSAGSRFERDMLRLCRNHFNNAIHEDTIICEESDNHRAGFDCEEPDEIYVFRQSGRVTREQAALLDTLNEFLRERQRIGHRILSARQDGYALWYYYHYVMRNLITPSDEKQRKYDCYLQRLSEVDARITSMQEQCVQLEEKISDLEKQIQTDLLKRVKDEPYWSPKTPTLMVRGSSGSNGRASLRNYRYGIDQKQPFQGGSENGKPLPCRIRTQLLHPKTGMPHGLTGCYPEEAEDFLLEACIVFDALPKAEGIPPSDEAVCRGEGQPQYAGLLWGIDYEEWGDKACWTLAEDDFVPGAGSEQPRFTKAGAEYEFVTDRCILTPHAETVVKSALEKYCQIHAQGQLKKRLRAMGNIDALSQTIGTFHEQLRGRKSTLQLPLFQAYEYYDVGTDYARFAALAKKVVQDQTALSVIKDCSFHAMRAGKIRLRELKLIDTFSRVIELKTEGIQIAEALEWNGEIILPPRLLQPARLLVSLGKGADYPEMYPIIGWLRYNHLNQSLIVYQEKGQCLGMLKLVNGSVKLLDGSLYLAVQRERMMQADGGKMSLLMSILELLQQHPKQFEQVLSVIAARQEEMKETGTTEADASVYMGRPLALLPASIMLEVKGEMIRDDSWCEGTGHESPLRTRSFPIRIGDRRYHGDGLTGFFMDEAFHQEIYEEKDFLAGNQIHVRLNEKKEMVLLMDIGLATTITTGILPRKEVKLESGSYHEVMESLRCSFLLGPTLQPHGGYVLPIGALPGTVWTLNGTRVSREYEKGLQTYTAREGILEMMEERENAGD